MEFVNVLNSVLRSNSDRNELWTQSNLNRTRVKGTLDRIWEKLKKQDIVTSTKRKRKEVNKNKVVTKNLRLEIRSLKGADFSFESLRVETTSGAQDSSESTDGSKILGDKEDEFYKQVSDSGHLTGERMKKKRRVGVEARLLQEEQDVKRVNVKGNPPTAR